MPENSAGVMMYATGLCGYCKAAQRLLDNKKVEYEVVRVDQDNSRLEEMMQKTGRRTVPQIYIGEHHVGGFDDLSELDAEGGLDELLAKVHQDI